MIFIDLIRIFHVFLALPELVTDLLCHVKIIESQWKHREINFHFVPGIDMHDIEHNCLLLYV
jgi:hypothetical protein